MEPGDEANNNGGVNNSAINNYIAGALGGMAGLVVGHPFDTTKVQMQTQISSSSPYKSTWDAVVNIKKHGWMHGFFRGMSFPLVSYGIVNSAFFGVYGNVLRWFEQRENGKARYSSVYMAGVAGGLAQLVFACPVDVVKVVMQSQIPKTAGISGSLTQGPAGLLSNSSLQRPHASARTMYNSSIQCAFSIYRTNGPVGFYKGLCIMAVRDLPASGAYAFLYQLIYDNLVKYGLTDSQAIFANLMSGGCAGVFSWLIIMPFDVLKSKLQADLDRKLYQGVLDCTKKTYRSGGLRAFTTGTLVTSLRAFPANAVIFLVYAECLSKMSNKNSEK